MRDAGRHIRGEPLSCHPSERAATKSKLPNLERIGDGEHITPELLDRVFSLGSRGTTVAARVVSHDSEVGEKIGNLKVPHTVIGAQ
jgi:hypothetical protein